MKIGIPCEILPLEKRVATVPEVVSKLVQLGFSVAVQSGAGVAAHCDDAAAYQAVGPRCCPMRPRCGQRRTSCSKCVRPRRTRWR